MLAQMKQTDIGYLLTYIIEDDDFNPVDLTGASATFIMGKKNKLVINSPAIITDPVNGVVEYEFVSQDALVSGNFLGEFRITFQDGDEIIYPRNGYITVNIQQNIDTNLPNIMLDAVAERQGEFSEKLDSILMQAGNLTMTSMNEYAWEAEEGQLTYVIPSDDYDPSTKWFQVYVDNIPVDPKLINRNTDGQFTLSIDPSIIEQGMGVIARWTQPIGAYSQEYHYAQNEAEWEATEGQLVYAMPEGVTYDPDGKSLEVSVGGIVIAASDVQKDNDSQFTLLLDSSDVPSGVKVLARWVEPYAPVVSGHKKVHEKGGYDEIDIAKLKNYEELVASPLVEIATSKIDVINVRQPPYNLKGDGTDEGQAIQNILSTGKHVYFPKPPIAYATKQMLTTGSNGQLIYGDGADSVIRNDSTMNSNIIQGTITLKVNHKNVIIRNISIHGDQVVSDLAIGEEASGTGHNIIFEGDIEFNAIVENVTIKNGYNAITIQNNARNVKVLNVNVVNCFHGIQIYNAKKVQINNYSHKTEAFRSSVGWSKRGITLHSGAQDCEINNVNISGARISAIYIRVEDLQNSTKNNNLSNINIDGVGVTFAGVYFHNERNDLDVSDINIVNLTVKNSSNGIMIRGASDTTGVQSNIIKNIKINNYNSISNTSALQWGGTGYDTYTNGIDGLHLVNVSADSNIRFKGVNSFATNVKLTNGATITGLNYQNVIQDGTRLVDSVTQTAELKMTTSGATIKNFEVITGTTPASGSSLTINYPTGYTKDNTQVFSFRIMNTNGVGVGVQNQVEASVTYGASSITLGFPASSVLYNCAYRVILVKA